MTDTLPIPRTAPQDGEISDHAEDALLDHAIVRVDREAYAAFVARLDAPPQPNERLKKTMRSRAPWA